MMYRKYNSQSCYIGKILSNEPPTKDEKKTLKDIKNLGIMSQIECKTVKPWLQKKNTIPPIFDLNGAYLTQTWELKFPFLNNEQKNKIKIGDNFNISYVEIKQIQCFQNSTVFLYEKNIFQDQGNFLTSVFLVFYDANEIIKKVEIKLFKNFTEDDEENEVLRNIQELNCEVKCGDLIELEFQVYCFISYSELKILKNTDEKITTFNSLFYFDFSLKTFEIDFEDENIFEKKFDFGTSEFEILDKEKIYQNSNFSGLVRKGQEFYFYNFNGTEGAIKFCSMVNKNLSIQENYSKNCSTIKEEKLKFTFPEEIFKQVEIWKNGDQIKALMLILNSRYKIVNFLQQDQKPFPKINLVNLSPFYQKKIGVTQVEEIDEKFLTFTNLGLLVIIFDDLNPFYGVYTEPEFQLNIGFIQKLSPVFEIEGLSEIEFSSKEINKIKIEFCDDDGCVDFKICIEGVEEFRDIEFFDEFSGEKNSSFDLIDDGNTHQFSYKGLKCDSDFIKNFEFNTKDSEKLILNFSNIYKNWPNSLNAIRTSTENDFEISKAQCETSFQGINTKFICMRTKFIEIELKTQTEEFKLNMIDYSINCILIKCHNKTNLFFIKTSLSSFLAFKWDYDMSSGAGAFRIRQVKDIAGVDMKWLTDAVFSDEGKVIDIDGNHLNFGVFNNEVNPEIFTKKLEKSGKNSDPNFQKFSFRLSFDHCFLFASTTQPGNPKNSQLLYDVKMTSETQEKALQISINIKEDYNNITIKKNSSIRLQLIKNDLEQATVPPYFSFNFLAYFEIEKGNGFNGEKGGITGQGVVSGYDLSKMYIGKWDDSKIWESSTTTNQIGYIYYTKEMGLDDQYVSFMNDYVTFDDKLMIYRNNENDNRKIGEIPFEKRVISVSSRIVNTGTFGKESYEMCVVGIYSGMDHDIPNTFICNPRSRINSFPQDTPLDFAKKAVILEIFSQKVNDRYVDFMLIEHKNSTIVLYSFDCSVEKPTKSNFKGTILMNFEGKFPIVDMDLNQFFDYLGIPITLIVITNTKGIQFKALQKIGTDIGVIDVDFGEISELTKNVDFFRKVSFKTKSDKFNNKLMFDLVLEFSDFQFGNLQGEIQIIRSKAKDEKVSNYLTFKGVSIESYYKPALIFNSLFKTTKDYIILTISNARQQGYGSGGTQGKNFENRLSTRIFVYQKKGTGGKVNKGYTYRTENLGDIHPERAVSIQDYLTNQIIIVKSNLYNEQQKVKFSSQSEVWYLQGAIKVGLVRTPYFPVLKPENMSLFIKPSPYETNNVIEINSASYINPIQPTESIDFFRSVTFWVFIFFFLSFLTMVIMICNGVKKKKKKDKYHDKTWVEEGDDGTWNDSGKGEWNRMKEKDEVDSEY